MICSANMEKPVPPIITLTPGNAFFTIATVGFKVL